VLRVEGIQKSFDGFMAVAAADLVVEKGEIVAVIGPNGAGKTTLFRIITGEHKPDKGRILFRGEEITGLPPHEICRKGVGISFQVVNIFNRMTVFDNVQVAVLSQWKMTNRIFAPARRLAVEETERILRNVGLIDKAGAVSGSLSHGDQKALEIAIALGSKPDLLILDEPTAGMAPEETAAAIQLIHRMTDELGLTILFCEHDMELVFSIADRIMVMHQGKSLIQANPDEVKCNKQVQEAYLGVV
jgi:branched-chain amino acid transport system ATP-binding protein